MTEDDVQFNFRLHSGPAVTRNAIKLLKYYWLMIRKLLQKAEERARDFLEKACGSDKIPNKLKNINIIIN